MVLIKEFRKSKDDDYESMSAITGCFRLVLKALDKGLIPHDSYTELELISFSRSLINNQEPDGSWPVHRPEDTISEEDQIDFVYFPTQIACSILSHVKQNHNCRELADIDEVLTKGLKFSNSKKLEGFGFNSMFQKLESMIIFTEGSVPKLLNSDPRICPSLYDTLIESKEEIQKRVDSGDTVIEFGGDYRETFEFILKGLTNL